MSTNPTAKQLREFATDPAAFRESLLVTTGKGLVRFGQSLAEFQRRDFEALDRAFVALSAGTVPQPSRLWIERTKGSSKNTDTGTSLAWLLWVHLRRPLYVQLAAGDVDQAAETLLVVKGLLRNNPWLNSRLTVQASRIVCEATDSVCQVLTSEAATSHGSRVDLLVVDEVSHIGRWEFVETLTDNLSKLENSVGLFCTNAGFSNSPAWRWRELARTSPRWHFSAYDKPAPWISEQELTEARLRNSHSRFQRLFTGVWSSGAGDALDSSDIQASIDPSLSPMSGRTAVRPLYGIRHKPPAIDAEGGFGFCGGLDLSVKLHHSAFVSIAVDPVSQRLRLADLEHWAPSPVTGVVDLEAIERAILEAHRRYRFGTILADPFQAALMIQRLVRKGVPVREYPFSGKNLDTLATTVLSAFRERRVSLFPCERLVDDLGRLRLAEHGLGYKLVATQSADGSHADTAFAWALAAVAAKNVSRHSGGSWGGTVNAGELDRTHFSNSGHAGPAWI